MRLRDKGVLRRGPGAATGSVVRWSSLLPAARVAAVDHRHEGLAETTALAGTNASRLSTRPLDVADRAGVAALPDAVIAAHGQVDGLLQHRRHHPAFRAVRRVGLSRHREGWTST